MINSKLKDNMIKSVNLHIEYQIMILIDVGEAYVKE